MRFYQRALAFALRSELFSIRPVPQIHQKKFGTKLGVFISFIVICFVLLYMGTLQRFLEGNATILLHVDQGDTKVELFPFSLSMPHIQNKSYFSVLVQHRTIPVFGARKTQKKVVDMVASHDPVGIDRLKPAAELPPLYGNCRTQACTYLRVKIFPCSNDTRRPSDRPCAPFRDIERIVNTNYFRLTMHMTEEGKPTERITDISLKTALSFRRQFRFDIAETVNLPDLLRSWSERDFMEMSLADDMFSIDRIPRETTGEDTEMCKIDIELTGHIVTRINKPQTSLDLIGSWSAFYGAMIGVGSVFILRYNRRRFYSTHPQWDNFDKEFQHSLRSSKGLLGRVRGVLGKKTDSEVTLNPPPVVVTHESQSRYTPLLHGEDDLRPPVTARMEPIPMALAADDGDEIALEELLPCDPPLTGPPNAISGSKPNDRLPSRRRPEDFL